MQVIKKNGSLEDFDFSKIVKAVQKSADRVGKKIGEDFTSESLYLEVKSIMEDKQIKVATVSDIHEVVQVALYRIDNDVFKEYQSYRDYKKRFTNVFNDLVEESNRIVYSGDKENANKNSLLVSTKKGLLVNELSKQIMLEYELPKYLAQAHKDGNLYYHDLGDRLFNGFNCCLFDMKNLLKDGFELNGIQYTEPTSSESFMRVFSDIILEASSQQYGRI